MAVVYQHKYKDNKAVFYIGFSSKDDLKRPYEKGVHHRSEFWNKAVSKHEGRDVEILFNNLDIKQALQIEKYLIAFYGRRDIGLGGLVNLTDGGELNLGGNRDELMKEVIQYNEDGSFVAEFKSLKLAAESVNLNSANISAVTSKRERLAKGYVWRFKGDSFSLRGVDYSRDGQEKSVVWTNYKGESISFDSIAEASRVSGVTRGSIIKHCKGRLTRKMKYRNSFKYNFKKV